jgi:hypothetical protein
MAHSSPLKGSLRKQRVKIGSLMMASYPRESTKRSVSETYHKEKSYGSFESTFSAMFVCTILVASSLGHFIPCAQFPALNIIITVPRDLTLPCLTKIGFVL